MEKRPHALLLKYPGTNCDAETARALEATGFATTILPVSQLDRDHLEGVSLVVFSGGFSYGDYIMSGRVARLITEQRIASALEEFRDRGGYLLGICNGFQILTQMGLLPAGSLVHNTSGRFICRWAGLDKRSDAAPLSFLPDHFELPVAHAEGRFVTADPADAERYLAEGLAPLTYTDDINGSFAGIAGLQDKTGRVFGLMPHPERFLHRADHYDPDWDGDAQWGWGYHFFRSLHAAVSASSPVPCPA